MNKVSRYVAPLTIVLATNFYGSMAEANEAISSGIPTEPHDKTLNYTYQISSPIKFIVNDLSISISKTVSILINENSYALAVATGSELGRTVFTGHTDIGAVTSCFTLTDNLSTDLTAASPENLNHLDINKSTGCDISSS